MELPRIMDQIAGVEVGEAIEGVIKLAEEELSCQIVQVGEAIEGVVEHMQVELLKAMCKKTWVMLIEEQIMMIIVDQFKGGVTHEDQDAGVVTIREMVTLFR